MSIIYKVGLLFLFLVFFGCESCNPDDDLSSLKLKWRTSFPTENLANSINPIVTESKVVFSNDFIVEDGFIVAYDKESGEELWQLNNEIFNSVNRNFETQVEDDKIYVFGGGRISKVSNDGNLDWSHQVFDIGGGHNWIVKNDEIFLYGIIGNESAFYEVNKDSGTLNELFRYDFIAGEARIFYANFFEIENETFLANYIGYSNSNNSVFSDSLLIFEFPSKLLRNSSSLLDEGVLISHIFDQKNEIIFKLKNKIYRFDHSADSILWQREIQRSAIIKFEFYNDFIYYVDANSLGNNAQDIVKISPNEGAEIWRIEFNAALNQITFHEDFFYLKRNGIYQKRSTATGEVVQEFFNPDDTDQTGGSFDDAFAIDPVTNDIYTADFTSALKYKNAD